MHLRKGDLCQKCVENENAKWGNKGWASSENGEAISDISVREMEHDSSSVRVLMCNERRKQNTKQGSVQCATVELQVKTLKWDICILRLQVNSL